MSVDRPWEAHTPDDYRRLLDEAPPATEKPRRRRKRTSGDVVAFDWQRALRKRGDGFAGDELNVLAAFRSCPALVGLARFNEFQNRIELTRAPPWRDAIAGAPWTDDDDLEAHAFLQRFDLNVRSRAIVADVAARVAREHSYHPVREYLERLQWDGRERLQHWLAGHMDARDPPAYLAAIGRRFLVSAVARVMRPGCKADHVLVLEGQQGVGKSSAVRILGAPWTTDAVPEFSGPDAALQLAGVWLAELPELAAMRRSDLETCKAFITRQEDHFRPPYGRRPVRVPRQCVFVATTNEAEYLRDATGNRRFWPVRCGRIELDNLALDRDQLWAEAVATFNAGAAWHLTPEEAALAIAAQSERETVTELEHEVAEYLARIAAGGTREVTVRDVLFSACNLDPMATDYVQRAGQLGPQVAHAMERAGWQRIGPRGRGESRRVVYRCSQGFIG